MHTSETQIRPSEETSNLSTTDIGDSLFKNSPRNLDLRSINLRTLAVKLRTCRMHVSKYGTGYGWTRLSDLDECLRAIPNASMRPGRHQLPGTRNGRTRDAMVPC